MNQLSNIEIQTLKTNGRVNEHVKEIGDLKLANLKHIIDCPAMPKIEEIKNDLLEYKWFKQHPKIGLGIITVCVAIILFNAWGIWNKKVIAKDLIIIERSRVKEYNELLLKIDSIIYYKK
jgi:hypothetical protein